MKIAIIGSRKIDGYRKKVIEKIIDKNYQYCTINIGASNKYVIELCQKIGAKIDVVEVENMEKANLEIAEMADVLIVVGGGKNSGTILVAQNFLEKNKNIYAVPGNIDDELSWAPNYLIASGSGVIYEMLTGVII